jgi:hypothetical protein
VHKRIISAVKKVEFISDITLRGRWFHIIVVLVHASTEGNLDVVKDSFYVGTCV